LALKEVDPVGLHRQSGIHAQEILKFKIAPHKQKSIVKNFFGRNMGPLTNGVLCLSTPQHNGKSGTDINDTPIFGCVFGNLKLEGRTSVIVDNKYTLENTEGAIKTRQYRETDSIEYTRQRNTKQKHNAICAEHHYALVYRSRHP
jgi:hypothetical protein